jgi:signal peptidase II
VSAGNAAPAAPAAPAKQARKARRSRTTLLVVALILAMTDLVVKAIAEALLLTSATTDFGPINIRLLYNRGVAFSLGADLAPWIVIAATGLIIAALSWYVVSSAPSMTALSRTGAALLLGGAIGNFIDRLDGQGVVDYLHSGWFPTFNLADVFVTTGVTLLVLGTMLSPKPRTNP